MNEQSKLLAHCRGWLDELRDAIGEYDTSAALYAVGIMRKDLNQIEELLEAPK